MHFIQYLRDPINAINVHFHHFDRLFGENLADRIEQCVFFVIFVSRKYVIKCQKCPNLAFYRFCVVVVVVVFSSSSSSSRRRRRLVGTILFFTFFFSFGESGFAGIKLGLGLGWNVQLELELGRR